jgi:hypothetical protein
VNKLLCLIMMFAMAVCAGESRPVAPDQMKDALALGERARMAADTPVTLLPSSALIVKTGGVRCGHALIRLEPVREAGATYKLTEVFKAATAEGGQYATVDYTGSFLLDEKLGLIEGKMETRQELQNPSANKTQVTKLLGTLSVKDNMLHWQRRELDEAGKELNATKTNKVELHNVRPIPRNALAALPKLMLLNGSLKLESPEKTMAICVPCVDLDYELNDLVLDAAWLTFDKPTYVNPKESAYTLRARYFGADVTKNGLDVETPSAIQWVANQNWAFAADGRILQHPSPGDPHVTIETVDAGTLDTAVPLDLKAIEKASEK